MTRSALGVQARLSGGALGRVLEDLVGRGVVTTVDHAEPGLRGKRTRYKLDERFGRVLAIGLGHDRLGVVVTDLAGTLVDGGDLLSERREAGWVDLEPTAALAEAAELGRRALVGTNTTPARLVGLGISVSAPLMEDGRPYRGFMDRWQQRNTEVELLT